MKKIKLEEVSARIADLRSEGELELSEELERDYEYAKQALDNITFGDLLLVFYVNCCCQFRFNNYFRMAKEEAIVTSSFLKFDEDWRKVCKITSEV